MMFLSSFCLRVLWAWPRGGHFSAFSLLSILISIALGILSGLVLGMVLAKLCRCQAGQSTQATIKGLILLACAFFAGKPGGLARRDCAAERPVGVMSMAVMVQLRTPQLMGQDLSQKVFQALDGCRADFVRPGGCCCGYFLCGLGRHWCHGL